MNADPLAASFIRMFNQHVDFTHRRRDGTHEPAHPTGRNATHHLVCTRWNGRGTYPTDMRKALREFKVRPKGYALAVCALPLHQARAARTKLLKLPINLDAMPVYHLNGTINGKRAVLRWLLQFCRETRRLRQEIRTGYGKQLDALYLRLMHANRSVTKKHKRRTRRKAFLAVKKATA